MPDEDFDRAQHRLRQEVAARDDWEPGAWTMPDWFNPGAVWAGDQPPEQVDRDAMANYNRCVIAEAARAARRHNRNWLAIGLGGYLALTVLYYAWAGIRWAASR